MHYWLVLSLDALFRCCDLMGKYDDISYRIRTHIDELVPFAHMGQPRDWDKIDEVVSKIPLNGERLMTKDELKVFYG